MALEWYVDVVSASMAEIEFVPHSLMQEALPRGEKEFVLTGDELPKFDQC